MGPVLLDANLYSNLYEAWSASRVEKIEDFDSQEVAASFYPSSA